MAPTPRRRRSPSPAASRRSSASGRARKESEQVSEDELLDLRRGAHVLQSRVRTAWLVGALLAVGYWISGGLGPDWTRLMDKRVVVTGASQGIGEELAYLYCQAGANVLLVARSKERLAAVAAECKKRAMLARETSPIVATLSADLSKVKGCGDRVVNEAKKTLGGLDILVLNHITSMGKPYNAHGWMAAPDVEGARKMFEVNTLSYMAISSAALPALNASAGSIVVVSSLAGKMGLPAIAGYSASKHALHGFFESLRHDLQCTASPISVSLAVLGSIDTPNARAYADLPNVNWAPAAGAARAVARVGLMRIREASYPSREISPTLMLRAVVPETLDRIVRAAMGPPLAQQAAAILLPSYAELAGGAASVAAVYALSLALHVVLPAERFHGYVLDADGHPLVYRINGFRVLLVVAAVALLRAALLGPGGVLNTATRAHGVAAASCLLGLAVSLALFLRGRRLLRAGQIPEGRRCPVRHGGSATVGGSGGSEVLALCPEFRARSALAHFYAGLEWNPRARLLGADIDTKMFLYLAGAVLLELNVLSAALAHAAAWGGADGRPLSNAMALYAGCMSWFVCEYLFFEDVHTFTYDLFAERVGFKLVWGCLCFYPNFYALGAWCLVGVKPPADLGTVPALLIGALFFAGWVLTRGANLQKFLHKLGGPRGSRHPAVWLVGWMRNETVRGSEGRLLCSGWWALSRHVNYFGEVVQAVALALPGWLCTGALLPWLYPLYYVLLFIPRQRDDDAACAIKYGAAWRRYVAAVPYRIVPGLY